MAVLSSVISPGGQWNLEIKFRCKNMRELGKPNQICHPFEGHWNCPITTESILRGLAIKWWCSFRETDESLKTVSARLWFQRAVRVHVARHGLHAPPLRCEKQVVFSLNELSEGQVRCRVLEFVLLSVTRCSEYVFPLTSAAHLFGLLQTVRWKATTLNHVVTAWTGIYVCVSFLVNDIFIENLASQNKSNVNVMRLLTQVPPPRTLISLYATVQC